VMRRLLLASVHDTLFALLGDARYLGARPGILATLHTWSQTLRLPPHIHGLVTGGGLAEGGHWVAVRHGLLWPMRVVMALFRGKWLGAIRQGVQHGQLTPPQGKSRQRMDNLLNKLGRQTWNGTIRERERYGHGVLVYLARYRRGGPLSNGRWRYGDGQRVVLRDAERAQANGGQAHPRTMRLPLAPCSGRWRWHVPPTGAMRVRCWGLYAHTPAEGLADGRRPLGQGPVEVPAP
jgi:hypothetical protein